MAGAAKSRQKVVRARPPKAPPLSLSLQEGAGKGAKATNLYSIAAGLQRPISTAAAYAAPVGSLDQAAKGGNSGCRPG